MPTDCDKDPFGAESDFELWPPLNPDDFECYESPDWLT